ncbi:restriction endonuclease subunit S [Candidatus Saccharibacteria bacterium]|nr:restriction endonuclease subunit S [Candidatus Saccharibacteria bacterium]
MKMNAKKVILPRYLYMFFNRDEFDRYAITNSWGSATELFTFEEMCDMSITLPDIIVQQKYVDIYESMVANQKSYEQGLDDLKLTCDAYIEDLRRNMKCEKIGPYIKRYSEKNTDKKISEVVGLSTSKQFRIAQSRVNREELGGYKILHPLDIAYVPTTDTWKVLAFAVNHFEKDVVVSPIYEVFAVTGKLNSDYLAMWLKREEFDRYARYNSWGSARENFTFEEMQNIEIPIPDEKVQKSIVDIYLVYEERKRINERLKQQIKDICPILTKGSLEE